MIQEIFISNLAIIDKQTVVFKQGLNVLTGETGAGKSILLDSLKLAFGERADYGLIQHGKESASVALTLNIATNNSVLSILKELAIEHDNTLILKRVIFANKTSKAYVNDIPVSISALKRLKDSLLEIHGQFDNQKLLNPSNHLKILDNFGNYQNVLQSVRASYFAFKDTESKLKQAKQEYEKIKQDKEYYIHAVNEIRELNIDDNEEKEILEKKQNYSQVSQIEESLNNALKFLSNNIMADANKSIRFLDRLTNYNISFKEELSEINDTISHSLDGILASIESIESLKREHCDIDYNIEDIQERYLAIKDLVRKYDTESSNLNAFADSLEQKLQNIELSSSNITKLEQEFEKLKQEYTKNALTLSEERKKAAEKLDSLVNSNLSALKLASAKFKTSLCSLEEGEIKETGLEKAIFEVATNNQSVYGSINKIASGGELARFMLAIKVVIAESDVISTMVFDEIDIGVGGDVADAIGKRLKTLSSLMQVLLVTHSHQVASCANNHLFVSKKKDSNNLLKTSVETLSNEGRLKEIARMISGETITDESMLAAKSLLEEKGIKF